MQYLNLSQNVYEQIKQQIIELQLKPGDKISEQILSEQFKISKTPAREALLKLAEDTLVTAVPYKGTFVSTICLQNIEDMLFIRNTVEKQVIIEFINVVSKDDLIHLEKILQNQKKSIEINDVHEFFKLDDLYHQFFYIITNHHNVYKIIQELSVSYSRVRYLSLHLHNLENLYNEHMNIFTAIKEKCLDDAVNTFENHISRIHIEKIALLEKYPTYFQ